MTARRRAAGEGSVRAYETAKGERYLIVYRVPDPATGKSKQVLRRGFTTQRAATKALREKLSAADKGEIIEPSKQPLGAYLDDWLAGMRVASSTRASYSKNVRLHVKPTIGGMPLRAVTGTDLTKLYRELEDHGRHDGKGGLSARTVRYIHTILGRAFSDAVKDGRLLINPAQRATPPSVKEAAPPEMQTWTAQQLRSFLDYVTAKGSDVAVAFAFMAATGVRRGEALALRWSDVDFSTHRVAVRRSVGVVKTKGAGQVVVEGPTKTGKPRTIDIDPGTAAQLRRHRAQLAETSLLLARDDALVFGTLEGAHRHTERFSLRFVDAVLQAQRDLPVPLPTIRLHDLRHTHATLLLQAGEPVKVVQERLGHASPTITLGVYAHVHPGMQAAAAARFATLMEGTHE